MDPSTVVGLMFLFIVVIVALIVFFGSFFMVEQAQVALIERFGKFARTARAGLNMKIPMIEKKAGRLSLRVQQLNVKVETKTSDNVFVDIVVSVQYHVVEGKEFDAFYRLTNPEQQITAHVFDAVRSQVPTMTLDHVFEKKSDIEQAVSEGLRHKLNNFGYDIDGSPVTDIAPDEKVRAAMNEINAASRLREAAEQQGEAVKIKTVKAAEAEKESKKLQGEGIAAERIAIAEGIRELGRRAPVGQGWRGVAGGGDAHADPDPIFRYAAGDRRAEPRHHRVPAALARRRRRFVAPDQRGDHGRQPGAPQ